MTVRKKTSLLENSRFYIVAGSICLSALIFFWLHIVMIDARARDIRLQQIYGLIAVLYWYLVLLVSAFARIVSKRPWLGAVLFMRRAFGTMVAYFALLHAAIALSAQLDGFAGVRLLPNIFKWALIFGLFALAVLLVMAVLSLDAFVRLTRFRYWKFISRISYVAGLLSIVHVWLIGTHVGVSLVQFVSFEALAVLFALESWRLKKLFIDKGLANKIALIFALSIWFALCFGLIGMKVYLTSYGAEHAGHENASGVIIHAH